MKLSSTPVSILDLLLVFEAAVGSFPGLPRLARLASVGAVFPTSLWLGCSPWPFPRALCCGDCRSWRSGSAASASWRRRRRRSATCRRSRTR